MFSKNYRESYPNGYGFSMCIGMDCDGEINVAVFRADTGALVYDTPVSSDTVRCESLAEAVALAKKIKALPPIVTP